MTALDGNAAAGRLRDVLVGDPTVIRCTCGGCGTTRVLAELVVYADAPGMVVRCPGCDAVVLRLVQAPGRTYVDLRGAQLLVIPDP